MFFFNLVTCYKLVQSVLNKRNWFILAPWRTFPVCSDRLAGEEEEDNATKTHANIAANAHTTTGK